MVIDFAEVQNTPTTNDVTPVEAQPQTTDLPMYATFDPTDGSLELDRSNGTPAHGPVPDWQIN